MFLRNVRSSHYFLLEEYPIDVRLLPSCDLVRSGKKHCTPSVLWWKSLILFTAANLQLNCRFIRAKFGETIPNSKNHTFRTALTSLEQTKRWSKRVNLSYSNTGGQFFEVQTSRSLPCQTIVGIHTFNCNNTWTVGILFVLVSLKFSEDIVPCSSRLPVCWTAKTMGDMPFGTLILQTCNKKPIQDGIPTLFLRARKRQKIESAL